MKKSAAASRIAIATSRESLKQYIQQIWQNPVKRSPTPPAIDPLFYFYTPVMIRARPKPNVDSTTVAREKRARHLAYLLIIHVKTMEKNNAEKTVNKIVPQALPISAKTEPAELA